MNRTMRHTRDRRTHLAALILAISALAMPAANAGSHPRTWHLTNILEEHETPDGSTFGPGQRMIEDGGNGTFPTGHLIAMNASTFGSRVWSASPTVTGTSFGRRSWTVSFGGESVITDLRFTVGSWDYRTGDFEAAEGEPAEVGIDRTGTFVPSSAFVIPAGRELALRVWVPRDTDTPSVIDVWDPVSGTAPSTLRLD